MKKLLLSIFTLSFFIANAQFIISESDFAVENDLILYATDSSFVDTNLLQPTGQNATWDFTSLNSTSTDSTLFKNPSTLPDGSLFGGSNLAYNVAIFQYFIDKNATHINTVGFTGDILQFIDTSLIPNTNLPDKLAIRYEDDGLYYINLDAQYGDTESGSVHGDFTFHYGNTYNVPGLGPVYIDSVRINEDVTFDSEIDGSGTVQLNSGTYYAIRQNANYIKTYSVDVRVRISTFPLIYLWQGVPNVNFSINERNYRYFGVDQRFPIVEISREANGAFNISRFQTNITGPDTATYNHLGVYDNLGNAPKTYISNGNLHISSQEQLQRVEIIDISGKIVEDINAIGLEFNRKFNWEGLYIVRITTDKGSYLVKVRN